MPVSPKKRKALLKAQKKRNARPRPTAQAAKAAKDQARNKFPISI